MFRDTGPRVFGLPPGADFPAILVQGLKSRMAHLPPEEMARVTIFLNTQRMRRRVEQILSTDGAGFLPRLRLVTDLGSEMPFADIPVAVSPLRRRLELTVLIDKLLESDPSLAPRSALYDLADSLADLMDELRGEGVDPKDVAKLDVSGHSAHWARSLRFLEIVEQFFGSGRQPDAQARQRLVIERLLSAWTSAPPQHPMIVAGSTGSRGTTALLMKAVADLPQGAIILPGFDFEMPDAVWDSLSDPMVSEDHPQFRFRRVMDLVGINRAKVQLWADVSPPSRARNQLLSLSLRPAPVTDQWLVDGKHLPDLIEATSGLSLIEAQTPRDEALAIALILRDAAETGVKAALISPDRDLTRRVAAALDRWHIRPDDSAGQPLALSPAGRFLRHIASLFGAKLTADTLLTVLKHPLAFSQGERGPHLLQTRNFELHIRRYGPAFPTGADLITWATAQRDETALPWATAVAALIDGLDGPVTMTFAQHLARHRSFAERFARGSATEGSGQLWEKPDGEEALAAIETMERDADAGGELSLHDYETLLTSILNKGEVRQSQTVHPNIMIWGTLEARVQGADLVVLGGLTDGSWPQMPPADPWLNRAMRRDVGLLLPERRIGLSAHDYQQAIAAPKVILSRSMRNAEAETVPSRWLNRLMNLMNGLPDKRGPEALHAMTARGSAWLALAQALNQPETTVQPAKRPSPRPPVEARPAKLSLTNIERLIRDPYAIYARYVLRLQKLNPLRQEADARLRGEVVHLILERFVKERPIVEDFQGARQRLLAITQQVLEAEVPWPTAKAFWKARMARAAGDFLAIDSNTGGQSVAVEEQGSVLLDGLPFTLFGTPDRIDMMPDGRLHLIDYKTGKPPTENEQAAFAKQLLLAAAMAERGGFKDIGPREVAKVTFVGVKAGTKPLETEMTPEICGKVWEDLHKLIGRYLSSDQGFTSRRAVAGVSHPGDYDHLARLGEWDMTDAASPEDVA